MAYICAVCGKMVDYGEVKGSMKHPYCEKCFEAEFEGDIKRYWKFMDEVHPLL